MNNITILLINLSNRPKRLLSALNELRKCKLTDSIIRIEACNKDKAEELKHNYISEEAYNNIMYKLKSTLILPTWGSVGCAISHYRAWKYINDNNIKDALILEDDIIINNKDKFMFNLNKAINFKGNDITLFSSKNHSGHIETYSSYENNHSLMSKITSKMIGCHCYLLKNNVSQKLVENTLPFTYQVDIELTKAFLRASLDIKIFNIPNSGIKQSKEFKSDVQYYFITLEELYKTLNLPSELSDIIYKYLPEKPKNDYYYYPTYNDLHWNYYH